MRLNASSREARVFNEIYGGFTKYHKNFANFVGVITELIEPENKMR